MPEARGTFSGPINEHQVSFYGLSTCIWCKRTRQFLEDQGVTFEYTYLDKLQGEEREAAIEAVRQWNPAVSFPTVVIDGAKSIVGYRTEEIKEALGL